MAPLSYVTKKEPGGSFFILGGGERVDVQTILLAMSLPFWLLERKLMKGQKAEEKKDEARRQNEAIVIEGVMAAITLGEATAKAVQRIPDAHCNGDMHDALTYATKVKIKHRDFIREQGIDALY